MPYGKDIASTKRMYKKELVEQVEKGIINATESQGMITAFNRELDVWDDCEEETIGIVEFNDDITEVRPIK